MSNITVYLIDKELYGQSKDTNKIDKMTDDEFVKESKGQGLYWMLKDFEHYVNTNYFNSRYYSVRFIGKN